MNNYHTAKSGASDADRAAEFARILANIASLRPEQIEALAFVVKLKGKGGYCTMGGHGSTIKRTIAVLAEEAESRLNSAQSARDVIARAKASAAK